MALLTLMKGMRFISNPKIVLTTLNAKFIHSSLALRSLKMFSSDISKNLHLLEFTINNDADFIVSKLFKEKADVIAFSCYIWNIETTLYIINTLKKISPETKIVVGGPEVSYNAEDILLENSIDIIVRGEGEVPFRELVGYFQGQKELSEIKGVSYKKGRTIIENESGVTVELKEIPFVYENDLEDLENRIIYYEASRGCPFRCSYCLSSASNEVRNLEIDRVFSDLDFFLQNKVKQVKFIDRTFNWNKENCLEIWKYLIKKDNGVTNFHFEICAELLEESHLDMLRQAREGIFQFEIGVQSTNEETLKFIERRTNTKKLFERIEEIKSLKNIHLHLDLIAGLPREDYKSFSNSFNDVYNLKPEQLQLGFLKLLKGSKVREESKKGSLVYREKAPYEILYTDVLSYSDILELKSIENMVDTFYNSRKFIFTCEYIVSKFETPFEFYQKLGQYWEENKYDYCQHTKSKLYCILYDFFQKMKKGEEEIAEIEELKNILKFDMFYSDVMKSTPNWLQGNLKSEETEKIKQVYRDSEKMKRIAPEIPTKQASKLCQIEKFEYDIINWIKTDFKILNKQQCFIIFNYSRKKGVNADGYPYDIVDI